MELPTKVNIALAGNPNCGKTSIFNFLTGSNQKVGNWGGVTVEKKEGSIEIEGMTFNFVDLPGIYSLSPYSIEEVISRNYITDEAPDIVINVVDAANIERNLYLTAQLLELGAPVMIALNMADVANQRGIRIDTEILSQLLGVPVIETIGRKGEGTEDLKSAILKFIRKKEVIKRHSQINYGKELESIISSLEGVIFSQESRGSQLQSISGIDDFVSQVPKLKNFVLPSAKPYEEVAHTKGKWDARWLVLRLLEEDEELISSLKRMGFENSLFNGFISQFRTRVEDIYEDDIETILSERIYAFVKGICKEAVNTSSRISITLTDKIDNVLTHPLFGLPLFGLIMYLMFQTTFSLGEYPMGWLESLFGFIGSGLTDVLPADSLLADLLVNGVIEGVGGVIVFLPNIVLLFLFVAIFEDSGYMARVAFLMDRLMHGIGLHGKSFISLLTGFGCNVPGVMAARTLENEKDRLITILINPFMSCGARLPVYIIFCGAFFPEIAGGVIFAIYIIGIAVAIISGKILRLTVLKGESAPFVMELPPYRLPTARSLILHMWERASLFLTKAGTIVLSGVIMIWALNAFPRTTTENPEYDRKIAAVGKDFSLKKDSLKTSYEVVLKQKSESYDDELIPFEKSSGFLEMTDYFNRETSYLQQAESEQIKKLHIARKTERIKQSYAGRIGAVIEPLIRPFGFDWRIAISLIPGFVAKEIVVGSLGVLFQVGEEEGEESTGLQEALRTSGAFTPFKAVLFMIFTLLYVPCLASVATIKRETNSWKWPLFSIFYSVTVAWLVTFVAMTIGKFIGLG